MHVLRQRVDRGEDPLSDRATNSGDEIRFGRVAPDLMRVVQTLP